MSSLIELSAKDISKSYNQIQLFQNWALDLCEGQIVGIIGANGSGKSTLLKILAGIIQSDGGKVTFKIGGKTIPKNEYYQHIGFVSPYLNLYAELTIVEHFEIIAKTKGRKADLLEFEELLVQFNLNKYKDKSIKVYSSGMLQKCKLILAEVFHPEVLFLDEPYTNLDEESINIASKLLLDNKSERITIIASNDYRELELCQNTKSL